MIRCTLKRIRLLKCVYVIEIPVDNVNVAYSVMRSLSDFDNVTVVEPLYNGIMYIFIYSCRVEDALEDALNILDRAEEVLGSKIVLGTVLV